MECSLGTVLFVWGKEEKNLAAPTAALSFGTTNTIPDNWNSPSPVPAH